jgi:D-sedoheptulose 7-phosphate isomerase
MENVKVAAHAERMFRRFPELECIASEFRQAYSILETSFVNGGTLYVCGNGGSASDGDHIVGELMKGFALKRPLTNDIVERFESVLGPEGREMTKNMQLGLRAMSLNVHPAITSAFNNDVDPEMTYAQQLFVSGRPGDVFVGISTSGNSKNVLNGFKVAKVMGLKSILFTGNRGGICEKYADCSLRVPSHETFIIQEHHLPMYHTLCLMIEERFYGSGG